MRLSDQEHNRLSVLKAMRGATPVCRTDLAQMTGLAGGTITEITADLLARGLVVEERAALGRRGRPRVHVRINPEGAFALAAFLGVDGLLTCDVVDLTGGSRYRQVSPVPGGDSVAEWVEAIGAQLARAIAEAPVDRAAIRQVGLSLPVVVDALAGDIVWRPGLPVGRYPAARVLEQALGMPVALDNITSVLARAEHWFGASAQCDDFLLVYMDLGLGAARYRRGGLMLGAQGANVEIGHVRMVDEGGRACMCGASGCLLAYASIPAILAQLAEADGVAAPDLRDSARALELALARDAAGDPAAQAIVSRAGRMLGLMLGGYVNLADPGRIVVLVGDAALAGRLEAPLRGGFAEQAMAALAGQIPVEVRVLDEGRFQRGAAALVLERLYRQS